MNVNTVRQPDAQLPRPGDVVAGKYRIESVVGTGGMGVVLGAVDVSLGRPVAIKFLSPSKSRKESAIARFHREARAAAALQSEHVARVFEVGTLPNGAPFIVMEHLRGADLSQVLLGRGALTIEEACDYILQACEALGEAHTRGIVHRDLKPQNLFLTQRPDGSPCIKVLDFGISKANDEETQNLTSTDVVMGTPLYMSPEQVRSLKNVDARSDIWALGSILFELLTASPIYEAPSASALCAMIAMDPPTPLRARRPQAPAELEALILRCLHKDPMGRFPDVAALAEALAPFASVRGRESATRISRVVRAGAAVPLGYGSTPSNPAAPHAMSGGMTTAGDSTRGSLNPTYPSHPSQPVPSVSNYPPPMMAGAPMQHRPSMPHQTTQETWQSTQTGQAPPKKGTSAILVALFGVLTGIVLLALAFGAGWYFLVYREEASTAAKTTPSAAPPATTVAAMTTPTVTTPTTTTTTTTATATATQTAPRPTPTAVKDAGAGPVAQKDAGVNPNQAEEERRAALARAAANNCRHHDSFLHRPNLTPDDRKKFAEQTRTFTCNKAPHEQARCERNLCLEACGILNDNTCIMMQKARPEPTF